MYSFKNETKENFYTTGLEPPWLGSHALPTVLHVVGKGEVNICYVINSIKSTDH